MSSAEGLPEPGLLSLPEDLFMYIVSLLNVRETCRLELVSSGVNELLSRPGRIGPCRGRLDFTREFGSGKPPGLDASRLPLV